MVEVNYDVALVQCVKEKLTRPARARDLYVSPWFRKASAYAECVSDAWWILSAEHGLVHPDRVNAPYDKRLKDMSARERRLWAAGVIPELQKVLRPGSRVLILAGKIYREHLVEPLVLQGCTVDVPMEHLAIGEQLHWLSERFSRCCGK